jgi:hypothetical protein
MSYRIAISFAAAAIGISCIATDASARGGGGGGGRGGGAPMGGVSMMRSYNLASVPNNASTVRTGVTRSLANKASNQPVRNQITLRPGPNPGPSGGGAANATGGGAVSATGGGGGAAMEASYVPTSYSGNATACGRYPYPPCKKVRTQ